MKPENYITTGILDLYVTGVLPEEEMRELSFLISQDPRLQAEVQAIETALLTYAETQAQLPESDLLPGIMEKIQSAEQISQQEAHVAQTHAAKKRKSKESAPAAPAPVVRPIAPRNEVRIEPAGSRLGWAAVLALFLLASAAGNVYLYSEWQKERQVSQNFESERNYLSAENQKQQADLKQAQNELAVFKNPRIRNVQLTGTDEHPGMLATVMYDPQSSQVYIKLQNLPAPPSDKQYQLWAIDESNHPMNAGILPQNAAPGAMISLQPVQHATAFAVTLEPLGGSSSPNMDQMFMKGSI
jgi:anti-sigma-K factor RskA